MSFDQKIILSNTTTLSFNVVSDNAPLTYTNDLTTYQSVSFIFNFVSIVILIIFALSLGHKMIGA